MTRISERKLREAFGKIKEEMNDHLDAINENTNEINSQNDYIYKLESMVLKLTERLDEMEMKLADMEGKKLMQPEDFQDIVLTSREKEVFLILYSRAGDLIDFKQIARSIGYTEELVRRYISSMIQKGIPIIKKYYDEKMYLVLDMDFRNLQAKENILKIY